MSKKEAMFRTKEAIIKSHEQNGVDISAVEEMEEFKNAKMNETLGVIIEGGSDYKVVDIKRIKDNKEAFLELLFGAKKTNMGVGHQSPA